MVAVETRSVGPIRYGSDERLVVRQFDGVRGRVEEHGQRQQAADDPNADGDEERGGFAHPRTQRMHDRHVPVRSTINTNRQTG